MPYLADIDAIIWLVIIVVSIIAQIVKGARKTASQAPKKEHAPRSAPAERRGAPATRQPQKTRSTYQDRKDELRQFLERIADPVPQPVPDKQSASRRPPARKRKATPPPPPTPKVTVRTPTLQAAGPAQLPTTVMGTADRTTSEQARELRQLLKKEKTQRQAILLREILGPPLALR